MLDDFIERLKQPEYTDENRCPPCTAVNLLIAAAIAVVAGRRNRGVGILVFLGGAALIYLRGYLVPGTPELTKRYLPETVLAAFGKADRPEAVDDSIAQHAAKRAEKDASDEPKPDAADPESDEEEDIQPDEADDPAVPREELDELLEQPMDAILETFEVVEMGKADIELVDEFREGWERHIDALVGDSDEQARAIGALFEEPAETVETEQWDDGRYYAFTDGTRRHSWINEAAMVSDLAGEAVLMEEDDSRWPALEPKERLSILRGFRVFLETCPACGGTMSATDERVESCCGEWDVIAVRCHDCETHVVELTPPDAQDTQQAGAGDYGKRGITR